MVKINQPEQFKNYLLQSFIQVKKKTYLSLTLIRFTEIQVKGHHAVVIFKKYKRSISGPTVTPTLSDAS